MVERYNWTKLSAWGPYAMSVFITLIQSL